MFCTRRQRFFTLRFRIQKHLRVRRLVTAKTHLFSNCCLAVWRQSTCHSRKFHWMSAGRTKQKIRHLASKDGESYAELSDYRRHPTFNPGTKRVLRLTRRYGSVKCRRRHCFSKNQSARRSGNEDSTDASQHLIQEQMCPEVNGALGTRRMSTALLFFEKQKCTTCRNWCE